MDASGVVFWLVVVGVIAVLAIMLDNRRHNQAPGTHVCATCGSRAMPTQPNKGSGWIEILLWLLFIVPGLIYSIWRRSNLSNRCRSCGAVDVVPVETPRGRKLVSEFGNK